MRLIVRIGICDDEENVTLQIEELIYKYETVHKLDIDIFTSGEELLDAIKEDNSYDLLYLDIEMKELDGIETARKIREINKMVKIIYVTSHENFSMTAYEVNAYRYMLKPINELQFQKYYISAIEEVTKSSIYFTYRFNKVEHRIPISNIIYFEYYKRSTYIRTIDGDKKCTMKIKDIEKKLKESDIIFFRTSLSILINPEYVYTYSSRVLTLKNNYEAKISADRKDKVREQFYYLKDGGFFE